METYGLEKLGIINAGAVYRNLTPAQLVEHALRRGEGTLSNTGALVVKTGKYTGRSANDKFIVDTPAVHDDIAWGKVNRLWTRLGSMPSMPRSRRICRIRTCSFSTASPERRYKVYQGLPHRQRAGQPESVHPPAAAPPHGTS